MPVWNVDNESYKVLSDLQIKLTSKANKFITQSQTMRKVLKLKEEGNVTET